MVVLGVLTLIQGLIIDVLGILPYFTPPDLVAAATSLMGSSAWSYVGWLNAYLPISEVAFTVTAIAGVFGTIWVVKLVIWLLSKFHLLGGS